MPIDPDAVGVELDPVERCWTARDCLVYALGVGAGTDELAFTTDNTTGVPQQALPTMAVVVGAGGVLGEHIGRFDWTRLVHAEQAFTLHRPVPLTGRLRATTRVSAIYDKGSGAVVVLDTTSVDLDTGDHLFTTTAAGFIRGEGGWGGDRGPSSAPAPPDRPPDHEVTYATRPDQALLYRLSGDRNRLHSDPAFAHQAGFDRPILHGLCTYGFTGRALLHTLCDGDPAAYGGMGGRFSGPVFPGDELTVRIWIDGDGTSFQTVSAGGTVVVDRGCFRYRGRNPAG